MLATTTSAADTSRQRVRHPPIGRGQEDLPRKRVGTTASAELSIPGQRQASTRLGRPPSSRRARDESMNSSTPPGWGLTKLETSSTLDVAAAPLTLATSTKPEFQTEVLMGILNSAHAAANRFGLERAGRRGRRAR